MPSLPFGEISQSKKSIRRRLRLWAPSPTGEAQAEVTGDSCYRIRDFEQA
jgi:hypothetical protein